MGTWQDIKDKLKDTWEDTVSTATDPQGLIEDVFGIEFHTTTEAVNDVTDDEEAGDELRAKQGTDVGIPVVYGTRRIGGILVYQEVQEDDGAGVNELMNLYQCWALCEGEVQSWEVFVDDVSLADSIYRTTDNDGYLVSYQHDWLIATGGIHNDSGNNLNGTSYGSDDGIPHPYQKNINTRKVSGSSWAGDDGLGDTHRMKGIACEQLTYRHHWDSVYWGAVGADVEAFGPAEGSDKGVDVWRSGLPKLAFNVVGKVIKDNAGATKSTSDPAWILYDYLINQRYGCSIPVDEIDNTSFATASAICADETGHSGTPRHECNIILDTTQPTLTNVKRILATCNGRLHWINGLYTMKIDDVYTGSGEFNFLEKHIIGGISIVGDSIGERLNQVTAKFINPDKKWKSDEVRYPDKNNEPSVYTAFLQNDNGVKHHKTINVGGVTNLNQARYLAKQTCLRSRDSLKVSFTTTAEAMNVIVGDVVTITHSTPAWTAKEFIVRSISLNPNGTCSLYCIEHNDAIYTWDTVGIPAEAPNTNLPDIKDVTAPIGLSVVENVYSSIVSAGVRIAVQLEWTSSGIFTTSHDVEYKQLFSGFVTKQWVLNGKIIFSAENHGFPENMPIVFTASDATKSNGVLPTGITEGVTYYVRPGSTGGASGYILTGLANNFHVSLTPNGDNIALASTPQAGIHGVGHSVVNPTPTWVNSGNTISKSMLLQDFSKGTFNFRVRARNAVGSISDWLTSDDVELEGVTALPQDVTGFSVANHGSNAIITVDPPTDATDISHCEIKVLQEGSELWADGVPVAQIAVGNTTTIVPVVEGTYVAKWINSSGTESSDYLDSGSVTSYGSELVATFAEQPAWAGTLDGFYETVDAGDDVLRFLGSSLWDTITENIDTWVQVDGLGGRTEPAIYTGVKRDLGAVLPARIHTNKIFTSLVTDGSNYMDLWGKVDLRESWDPISQLDNLTVQVRITEDDPADAEATWTAYREFLIIDVVARGIQIKVTFDQFDQNSQFTLRELELLVDMVQKFESDRAQTAVGTITYDTPFYSIPDLVVTPTNMATGDYMTISSEAKTGFGINFYNSSAGAVTRNYNYIAKGV